MKKIASIVLFCLPFLLLGQVIELTVDTINIYCDKSGVGYGYYKRHWFGKKNTKIYHSTKFTHQDSIVLFPQNNKLVIQPHYFKVYSRRSKLRFEGEMFAALVTHFYRNGSKKQIEYWEDDYKEYHKNGIAYLFGKGNQRLCYKIYRKNGTLKKIVFYELTFSKQTPEVYYFKKIKNCYSRKGELKVRLKSNRSVAKPAYFF